jgi:hypothetical protein
MAPEMEATLQGVQMGLTAAAVSIALKAALDLSAKLASEPLTRWLNALEDRWTTQGGWHAPPR